MYPFTYPHRISSEGEVLIFEEVKIENDEKILIVRNEVKPNQGPPFHVHFKQDECLTVTDGKLGYQIHGEEERLIGVGETVLFERGSMHRFWNAGEEMLECSGWIKPANSVDYFLSSVYDAMNKSGTPQGDPFDMAYLMVRYRTEYDLLVIPKFVKRIVMPITVFIGRLLGKYAHFKDAPKALK